MSINKERVYELVGKAQAAGHGVPGYTVQELLENVSNITFRQAETQLTHAIESHKRAKQTRIPPEGYERFYPPQFRARVDPLASLRGGKKTL